MGGSTVPIKWTREQRRGIETVGRSLLVSAAAGSGKTAVLAARCAWLVCDAPEPHRCDVDQLLVVTFTKAAAAEMRNRIERSLREKLADGNQAALTRQLMLLGRAHISTLHSFCSTVIRRHFNLAGLDPNFKTLDQEEAYLLRIETARQLLADRYENDNDGTFQRFIDAYADGYDERILFRIVHAHNLLSSVVDPEQWLKRARQRIDEAAGVPPVKSVVGRKLAELVGSRLGDFIRRCTVASEQFARHSQLLPYVEYVNEMIAGVVELRDVFAGNDFTRLAETIRTFAFPDLTRMSNSIPGKEDAKDLVDSLRNELKGGGGLFELCRFTAEEWREGMKNILAPVDVLIDLIRQFSDRYTAAKREIGSLDFNDLERLTLQILRAPSSEGSLVPSGAARAYHREFKHVLVDEYQDINEVQDAILTLISRECVRFDADVSGNLFCVGDVKQSIYRFRLADPRRFLERNIRLRNAADASVGEVIDLQSNFRSRSALLEALNCVFERLMTQEAAEIEYDHSQRLFPGAIYPAVRSTRCFTGAPIELHLIPIRNSTSSGEHVEESDDAAEPDIELDRTEREAAFIAQRIRQLLGKDGSAAMHVLDKSPDGSSALRPVQFRDIVVLLRATQYKSNQFADMLRLNGVPVHSDTGQGFFDSMEIRDMLALLALLDNCQQDIPLAAVLRSPLSGLADPDDCLARMRLGYPQSSELMPFHRAVVRYAREKDDELAAHLRDLLCQISHWRELAHQRPLAELIWTIYDSSGYLAFCSGLEDGEQRAANLIQLHERARQFGSFQRQGLRRFMQFLQTLRDEQDLGQPSIASEADDVVRVMSIHRSKGLEFPIVIVADLGKRHNLQDTTGAILIDREAGLGMACVDEKKRIRYPSMASVLVQQRIRRQTLAEELRVLYVAMTRAREHLILVGTCKSDQVDKWQERWAMHQSAIPADDVLRGNCPLDWLGPVAAATTHFSPQPIKIHSHDEEEMKALCAPSERRPVLDETQQSLARLEQIPSTKPAGPQADELFQRLTDPYPHGPQTLLPAARTVGSLTKRDGAAPGRASASRASRLEQLPPPRCVLEAIAPSAMEIGSATHLILQHLDFSRPGTRDDLQRQILQMIERKLIDPAGSQLVDVDAIQWLLATDLGEILRRHAKQLRRELPIFFALEDSSAPADPMDQVMVRGRIDVMVPTRHGVVLVDYKTDRVTPETLDQRAEFYRAQVQSYSRAISGIVDERVASVYLVFLAAREIRIMDD